MSQSARKKASLSRSASQFRQKLPLQGTCIERLEARRLFSTVSPTIGSSFAPDWTFAHELAGSSLNTGTPKKLDPVVVENGTLSTATVDLESDGFGSPWGVTRSWTNNPAYAVNDHVGNGWDIDQNAQLIDVNGDQSVLSVITDGSTSITFSNIGSGVYSSWYNEKYTLIYNSVSDLYTMTDILGNQTTFYGFSNSTYSPYAGTLDFYQPASGSLIKVTAINANGSIAEEQRNGSSGGNTITESLVYRYFGSDTTWTGELENVMLERSVNGGSPVTVRQVEYTYYDGSNSGTETGGIVNDLRTASIEDSSGRVLSTDYYRYITEGYTDIVSDSTAYVSELSDEMNGPAFARAQANVVDVFSADTNSDLGPYWTMQIDYGYAQYIVAGLPVTGYTQTLYETPLFPVSGETVNGIGATEAEGSGAGIYRLTTSFDNSPDDIPAYTPYGGSDTSTFNSIYSSSTEFYPNGLETIYYFNFAGQILATDSTGDTGTRYTYDIYDAEGNLIEEADSNAVSDLSISGPSLTASLNADSGEVDTYNYDTGTSTAAATVAGTAMGYLASEYLQPGSNSSASTLVESYDYKSRAANGVSIFYVADDTVYQSSGGSGEETTSYQNNYSSNTATAFAVTTMVTTAPAVSATMNGPGTATADTQEFDADGNVQWEKDPDGHISFTSTDVVTGGILETITDVNTSTSDSLALSTLDVTSPFTLYAGDGLSVVNNFDLDPEGRVTGEQDGDGNWTDIVYDDVDHETLIYPGWHNTASGYYTTTGPVQVEHDNWAYGYVDTFDYAYQPSSAGQTTSGGGLVVPTGNDSNGVVTSLTREEQDNGGQTTLSLDYVNLSGVTFNASNATLFLDMDTNYYTTSYAYDNGGNLDRVQTSDGTIERTVYDQFDEPVSTWIGAVEGTTPDDNYPSAWSPASTGGMVEVSAMSYDSDGNETEMVQYPNGTGSNGSASIMYYDFRDQLIEEVDGAVDTGTFGDAVGDPTDNATSLTAFTLDNLGETVETKSYAWNSASTGSFSTSSAPIVADFLLTADSTTGYDSQGDVYETTVDSVSPTTFATDGPTETTNDYYDADENLIAELDADGTATKYVYNGAGWNTLSYITDGGQLNNASNLSLGSTNAYIAASTITNDVVLSQQQNVFDNAGNTIETISADRFGTDPTTGSSAVGALNTSTSGVEARLSYTDSFFDSGERDVADVNVGTYNGSSYPFPTTDTVSAATTVSSSVVNLSTGSTIPSGTAGDQLLILTGTGSGERATVTSYGSGTFTLSVNGADWGVLPDSSSTFALIDPGSQVSQTSFTPAGYVSQTLDPKGIATGFNYDALGETLTEVNDDTAWGLLNLSASVPTDSSNQTTSYTYDGDGNELTMTANMPSGETSQVTHYIYGVNTGSGSFGGSRIDDNDLLAKVQYPDPVSGTNTSSGTYNQSESYKYNAVGQQTSYIDRNLTTHTYTYDPAFRLTRDSVTFGSLDPASNTVSGLAYGYNPAGQMSTASSLNSSGGVLNQIGMAYNGFGDLDASSQAHAGNVSTGTPTVGYTYNSSAGDTPTGIVYPDGRDVSYNYATGLSADISQLSSISDGSGTIQSYSDYLGLGIAGVTTDGNGPGGNGVTLSYMNTAAGSSALNTSNGGGGDEYTGIGRFGWVVDQNWGTPASGTTPFTSVDRVQSGYDADGNVTWQNNAMNSSQSEVFTNDSLNRLTGYNRGSITVLNNMATLGSNIASGSWTLNAVGGWNSSSANSVTTTRNNSANNQIYNVGSATLHYDKSGDTTTDENGDTDIYDAWHRLVQVIGSNGTVLAQYSYDATGERITQTDSGSPTTDLFYSSQWQVLQEQQGSLVTAQEVWSPFDIDNLVERDTNPDVTTSQSNGSVDTTFGTNTTTHTTTGSINTSSAKVVADGSDVLMAGLNGSTPYLSWYTASGTLDTAYGSGTGLMTQSGTGWTNWTKITGLLILPGGNIVIAGSTTSGGATVAQLTPAGAPDTYFGDAGNGIVTESGPAASAIALAKNGDILVAGSTSATVTVTAINPIGVLDSSFGTYGVESVTISGLSQAYSASIAVEPDGEIVVGGQAFRSTYPKWGVFLVGLTAAGQLDSRFGSSGVELDYTRLSSISGVTSSLISTPDGNILIGSFATYAAANGFYLEEFTPEGQVNTSFGTNGLAGVVVTGDYELYTLAIDVTGQIVVGGAGYTGGPDSGTIALARFNLDGSLDTSFGTSGVETGASSDLGLAMTTTISGKTFLAASNTSGYVEVQQFNTVSGPQRLYAETDADDNVTSLTNSSGTVVERYLYDPYGNVTVLNPDFSVRGDGTAASSDYGWVYLHQGLRLDVVLGVYDNRMRIYDPSTGTFKQSDPDGYVNGANTYQYELSNPVGSQDPTGLTRKNWDWTDDAQEWVQYKIELYAAHALLIDSSAVHPPRTQADFLDESSQSQNPVSTAAQTPPPSTPGGPGWKVAQGAPPTAHNLHASDTTPALTSPIQAATTSIGLKDPATGRFVPDPSNPASQYKFTDADRVKAWKKLAVDPQSSLTDDERRQILERGRGPQRVNPDTGEIETKELSHEPIPLRDGGTEVVPRWPADHAAVDPYRQLGTRSQSPVTQAPETKDPDQGTPVQESQESDLSND